MSEPARGNVGAPVTRWTLREDAPTTTLVRSAHAYTEQLGGPCVHRLSREETAAWHDVDDERRDEARTAIRDAVREHGGGELRDVEGRLLEVVHERTGRSR